MPVEYFLVENRIGRAPDDFYAIVSPGDTVDTERLVQRIMAAGSTVTEPDIRAVLALLQREVGTALAEGCRVNLEGLGHWFATIGGVFHGATDRFDPARHTLQISTQADAALVRGFRRAARLEKQTPPDRCAVLVTYQDLASGTVNSILTSGTIGTLLGARLRFVPTRPEEGLFLVPEDGGPAVRVPGESFQMNKPGRLVFLVPALAAGQYRMEVRNRPRLAASAPLRINRLNYILSRA